MVVMHLMGMIFWIAIAVGMYALRCRHLFWYGMSEIVIGVAVLGQDLIPTHFIFVPQVPSPLSQLIFQLVTVLLGVAILVRGLDNVGQGLSPARRAMWDRVFRGKRKTVVTMREIG